MNSAASVAVDERMRLFCGLLLPDEVVDTLVEWQGRHLVGGRIVPPDHLHITLAFLGTTPAGRVPDIADALRAAAARAKPIEFSLPRRRLRETRSVAMLVLEDLHGTAGALAKDLFRRLEALGVYERERRKWLPHVTVLRFRERPRLDPPLPELDKFSPSGAAVYHSVLRSTGAQYEVLQSVALGG